MNYECRALLPRDDCLARGGRWYSDVNACTFFASRDANVVECEKQGGSWGRFGARMEHCALDSERAACVSDGGRWEKRGLSQLFRCIRESKDGGKVCTDRSECEFECLYDGPPPRTSGPEISGRCSSDNDRQRWHGIVHKGQYSALPVE
jgi:hypothetical protein